MKCPHCGSANMVKIQDQLLCLSCGHAELPARVTAGSRGSGAVGQAPPATPQGVRAGSHFAPPPHPLRFSLTVAGALGLATAAVITLVFIFQIERDIATLLILALAVSWLAVSLLSQGALLYGISRAQDGRPAPHRAWWGAARSGFLETLNVNVAAAIGLAVLVAVGAVTWHWARHELQGPVLLRVAVLGLVNAALIWLGLGIYVSRRLAVAAVVVGNVAAADALRVGWQLYVRGGGHLVAAGLEAVLGRAATVAGLGVALYALASFNRAGTPSQTALTIGGVVVVALAVFALVFVMLEWESRVWLRQYRHWATTYGPAERVRLLTGRIRGKA